MAKAKDAFRTISEVADWLDTPTHVLRFWESKFSQIKPVKGAGGRRYYRPRDMELLGGLKQLLHEDGMTIKGAQKLLREKGIKHVSGLGRSVDDLTADAPQTAETVATPEPPKAETPAVAVAQPAPPRPASPIQDALPFDMPDLPAQTRIPLPPEPPQQVLQMGGRLIGRITDDPAVIAANAEQIAPLLERLAALRDRLAG